jgi:hypothetical protein
MSKKTEALEVILGLMPNAKFIDKNGKDVTEDVKKSHNEQTLTELWKKGELEEGRYYLKDNEYIFIDYFNGVSFEETCDFEIKEVLAPVPSWEQWLQMKAFCEGFNALSVAKENQRLKELLKECNLLLIKQQDNDEVEHKESAELILRIDEVLD